VWVGAAPEASKLPLPSRSHRYAAIDPSGSVNAEAWNATACPVVGCAGPHVKSGVASWSPVTRTEPVIDTWIWQWKV
jgi:hypothetical protein